MGDLPIATVPNTELNIFDSCDAVDLDNHLTFNRNCFSRSTPASACYNGLHSFLVGTTMDGGNVSAGIVVASFFGRPSQVLCWEAYPNRMGTDVYYESITITVRCTTNPAIVAHWKEEWSTGNVLDKICRLIGALLGEQCFEYGDM